MAFKTLFIAHAPDAEHSKHKSIIDTGMYRLISVVVKNQEEAVVVSEEIYHLERMDSIILCPGFTHKEVAEIFERLNGKVSVNVARGDGPSSRISRPRIQEEYYTKKSSR